MLRTVEISNNFNELSEIERLYRASFPRRERDPFKGLVNHQDNIDFRACYDNETLVGMYVILMEGDLAHILFLAVEESSRDKGFGSEILKEICFRLEKTRLLVDIEAIEENSPNLEQRIKRKKFYLHNGFQETDINYLWHGIHYQILVKNGTISKSEFRKFWNRFESDKAARHYK